MLTPEHEAIRMAVREFAEQEVAPIADRHDRENREIPTDILKRMAELGYFGLTIPEAYGGLGLDYASMAIVAEELSRAWLSVGSVMTRNLITGTLLLAHGTEEQKQRFLPGIAGGDLLTAAAFTEPDAGSDTAAISTRAVRHADEYLVTGAKTWCTIANRAHILTTLVRTDPDPAKRHKGLSILLIQKEPGDGFDPPAIAGEPIPTIGYHGMTSFSLSFDRCPVPAKNLIGEREHQGFYQLMATYESARLQTAARAVGVAQAAYEAALTYAKQRVQFGQPISNFPSSATGGTRGCSGSSRGRRRSSARSLRSASCKADRSAKRRANPAWTTERPPSLSLSPVGERARVRVDGRLSVVGFSFDIERSDG
ncbi:MAG: acyl-CoA dehydrogenase family protein [candidate division NC10 bacterium]|nr:acyl-CoA dehydrogenase family protein [candidate division NC10 bacterium]